MRRLVVLVVILIIALALWNCVAKYYPNFLGSLHAPSGNQVYQSNQPVKVVTEESVTIDTVKKVGPSVVTVSSQPTATSDNSGNSPFDLGPFGFFGVPGQGDQSPQPQAQSIGSGFIISSDGTIITNKHVVSDTTAKYQVITADNKKYDVQKISRDPSNDIAILKIDPGQNPGENLPAVTLGDSSHLQVGQFAIAIGTALGEFRNTVTTGIISGIGRGITAGDQFQGSVEDLSNVIQTSAAINPGNSGGPLLNSSGQVIGINTAVASNGQNIGFALPINVLKDSLNNFNQTGFVRPYLGVGYKMIAKDIALMNDVPEGAYLQQVVSGSPADKAGLQSGDIITELDGQRLNDSTDLASLIDKKKPGDTVKLTYWRDSKTSDTSATLSTSPNQ